MAEDKSYYLYAFGQRVEVKKAVYCTYHQMLRRERYLEERDQKKGRILYSDWDTPTAVGEEMLQDHQVWVEEQAIKNILLEQLWKEIARLPRQDQEILHLLFWEGLSERQAAECLGLPRMTLNYSKHRILKHNYKKLTQ